MEDPQLKIIVLGESGVGKSSLMYRYTDDKFNVDFLTTIGVEFRNKYIELYDKRIKLQIWDTAGQEKFRSITPMHYKDVDGVIFVYDITNQKSFDQISYWLKDLEKHKDSNIQKILVGAKSDLKDNRQIQQETGKDYANQNDLLFLECSSKDNSNIEQVFLDLTQKIIQNNKNILPKNKGEKLNEILLNENKVKNEKCKC